MRFPSLPRPAALLLSCACLLWASAPSLAHDYKLGALEIGHPWARSSAPGQRNGSVYLVLKNSGGAADRLVSATTPVAGSVEMHMMRMDGDVMRMRQLDAIELGAGGEIVLKPGAEHLMLIGLKQPLKVGDSFELTLQFEKAGRQVVQVKVEAAPGATAHRH